LVFVLGILINTFLYNPRNQKLKRIDYFLLQALIIICIASSAICGTSLRRSKRQTANEVATWLVAVAKYKPELPSTTVTLTVPGLLRAALTDAYTKLLTVALTQAIPELLATALPRQDKTLWQLL
jgi:hypothetical protein